MLSGISIAACLLQYSIIFDWFLRNFMLISMSFSGQLKIVCPVCATSCARAKVHNVILRCKSFLRTEKNLNFFIMHILWTLFDLTLVSHYWLIYCTHLDVDPGSALNLEEGVNFVKINADLANLYCLFVCSRGCTYTIAAVFKVALQ